MPIDEASKFCHFIINNDSMVEAPQSSELITRFQKGNVDDKKRALQTLIKLISNDENYPRLLMPVLTNLQMS
jgi:vesicle coat complex subunit